MEKLELTGPEAGIALSVLVAFSDDNPSDEEAEVMRKYYRYEDAESFQNKIDEAGYKFPEDLPRLEPLVMATLRKQDRDFQVRTLAVALVLACSDGVFDQDEMKMLNKFCPGLGISLHEADIFSKTRLKELDEVTGYSDFRDAGDSADITDVSIDFTLDEAGAALAILVGLSDDDPSDEEAAVMREYYSSSVVSSLMGKMSESGIEYPDNLISTKKMIFKGLSRADRDLQKKYLAIAYKVAGADGVYDDSELELIEEYCQEYGIGMAELKDYFKTSIA